MRAFIERQRKNTFKFYAYFNGKKPQTNHFLKMSRFLQDILTYISTNMSRKMCFVLLCFLFISVCSSFFCILSALMLSPNLSKHHVGRRKPQI